MGSEQRADASAPRGTAPLWKDRVYPESRFGGFTRWDGTVAFLSRVHAILAESEAGGSPPSALTVLDVGCGRGAARDDRSAWRRSLADLRGPNRKVIGIDVDVAAGQTNPLIDEFRAIPADFRWPVEDASVDIAVSRSVIEHVPEPESYFRELARVLKPGGAFAAHTPNRFGYPALVATLVPNRMHARVVGRAQGDRKEEDVFPTVYRANTRGRLRGLLARHALDGAVYTWEAEPSYLAFSPVLYRVGAWAHRCIPSPFRTVIFVFARKRT